MLCCYCCCVAGCIHCAVVSDGCVAISLVFSVTVVFLVFTVWLGCVVCAVLLLCCWLHSLCSCVWWLCCYLLYFLLLLYFWCWSLPLGRVVWAVFCCCVIVAGHFHHVLVDLCVMLLLALCRCGLHVLCRRQLCFL